MVANKRIGGPELYIKSDGLFFHNKFSGQKKSAMKSQFSDSDEIKAFSNATVFKAPFCSGS